MQSAAAEGEWTLQPQSEWSDPFSPLYRDADGVLCEGDPTAVYVEPMLATRMHVDDESLEEIEVQYVVDRALIDFKQHITAAQVAAFMTEQGLQILSAWFDPDPDDEDSISWFHVKALPSSPHFGNTPALIAALRTRPEVRYADYNDVCPLAYEPNDPKYLDQSPVSQPEFTWLNAQNAWDVEDGGTAGSTIGVVVLDSGIDMTHPDLGTTETNPALDKIYRNAAGIRQGIAWLSETSKIVGDVDSKIELRQGNRIHGTGVAGVIGAKTNNGVGVASCGPRLKVMSARTQRQNNDPTLDGIIGCVKLLKQHYNRSKGFTNLRVVNVSIEATPNETLKHAINQDRKETVGNRLWVGAAGNSKKKIKKYPAAYGFVLGVTGAFRDTSSGTDIHANSGPSLGSNFWQHADDDKYRKVYGISAYYGWTTACDLVGSAGESPNDYGFLGGTSAAAPQVSAIAGLLFAQDPERTPNEVARHIKRSHKLNVPWLNFGSNNRIPGVIDFQRALDATNNPVQRD